MFKPRALGKAIIKRASAKVFETLGRADELGGKLRDQMNEKLAGLSAARRATDGAEAQPSAVSGAAKTTANGSIPRSGLGDPARPVQIFGRTSCPWTGRAIALLERSSVEHAYFDLEGYGSDAIVRELKLETKQDTVPYIYVRGQFVGGYNALDELDRLGQLAYLVLPDSERRSHPMHGRIEVASRTHDGERFPGA